MTRQVLHLSLVLAAGWCHAEHRPDLVEKVRSGEQQEARASWWGFHPEDATSALQAAVRSGVPQLTVDNVGKPWIVRPIHLVSNQEIVFEKGVVVEAKRGEFKRKHDCLFSISQKENVILRGHGATLRMHRADYDDPTRYEKAEWRHVLSIRSSKNIEVHGLTLALSGGDGIYLGVSKRGVPDENVVIQDVVCDRNYRQGISVIAARNLLIENTVMKNTAGKLVWEKDRITLPEMFAPELGPPEKDQVWRLRLQKPTGVVCEDYYVELRGIPPFLAPSPKGLLKAR